MEKNNKKIDFDELLINEANQNSLNKFDIEKKEEISRFVLMINEELRKKRVEPKKVFVYSTVFSNIANWFISLLTFRLSSQSYLKLGVSLVGLSLIVFYTPFLNKQNVLQNIYTAQVKGIPEEKLEKSEKVKQNTSIIKEDWTKSEQEVIVADSNTLTILFRSISLDDTVSNSTITDEEIVRGNLIMIQKHLKENHYLFTENNNEIKSVKEFNFEENVRFKCEITYKISQKTDSPIKLFRNINLQFLGDANKKEKYQKIIQKKLKKLDSFIEQNKKTINR